MPGRHPHLTVEPTQRAWRTGWLVLALGLQGWADPGFGSALSRIEARLQGRIGVFALRGAAVVSHRAGERFAYCSTFKWVLAAAILKGVDEGRLDLDRIMAYGQRDLLPHSPVTASRVKEGGMSIGALCAATIATSDNAAANLLGPLAGGPAGLQAFVRGLGDSVMRFDRVEPQLNSNLPGDPRDTTSPEAMARLLRTVLETDVLSRASRERLLAWMKATATGANRIRAGLPQGWAIAHKTGTGSRGAVNDVAVLFPPEGTPVYLCVFIDGAGADDRRREAAIAEATRLALKALRQGSLR